jgi:ubiquitin carboxyl-terminal hydrolase 34
MGNVLAAAYLLVALVPNTHFRQIFCMTRTVLSPLKEGIHVSLSIFHIAVGLTRSLFSQMSQEGIDILHEIYGHLLNLLSHAWQYADPQAHGTSKLVQYFNVMQHCLISRTEKIMVWLVAPIAHKMCNLVVCSSRNTSWTCGSCFNLSFLSPQFPAITTNK